MHTIDLELNQVARDIRELEVRLRVAPMNDPGLTEGLERAISIKRERLERLRSIRR